jgi:hypothetical protein
VPSFYLHDQAGVLRFRLVGDFGGADALEFERSWRTAESTLDGRSVIVDLSEIRSADPATRRVLRLVGAKGARFLTATAEGESLAREVSGRNAAELATAPQGLWQRLRCWFGCCCRTAHSTIRKCLPCRPGVRRIW